VVRDGDNGLLVQVRDSVTLADVLRRLLASPALRAAMGRRGRERAEQEFSLEGVIAQTIAVYDEATAALGGRVPPRLPGSPETGATGGAR
jgi:glycosyltransferase involved in cell wall biosynthesis